MKKIISILVLSLLLGSCKSNNKTETVQADNQYTLDLPSFLSKTDQLNKNASLQYQNTNKEFYVVVIKESKAGFKEAMDKDNMGDANLKNYSNFLTEDLKAAIPVTVLSPFEEKNINGLNARTISLSAPVNNNDFYWKFAFIEGNSTFYQVITWTLKDQKEKYDGQMEAILQSFKEISKK